MRRPATPKTKFSDGFSKLGTENGGTLKISQLTVAYARPKNLREVLTASRLYQVPGRQVYTILDRGARSVN